MNREKLSFDFSLPAKFSAERAKKVAAARKITEPPKSPRTTTLPSSSAETPAEIDNKAPGKKEKKIEKNIDQDDKRAHTLNVPKETKQRSEKSLQLEKETLDKIKGAQSRDELADIVVSYLGSLFERAALLLVTKTHFVGWRGCGHENFVKNITNINIPREIASIFSDCFKKENPYTGLWNTQKGDSLFFESLHVTRCEDMTVIPIIYNKKVFSFFYGDNYRVDPHHITPFEVELPGIQSIAHIFSDKFFQFIKK